MGKIVRRLLWWPRAELMRVWTGGEREQQMRGAETHLPRAAASLESICRH